MAGPSLPSSTSAPPRLFLLPLLLVAAVISTHLGQAYGVPAVEMTATGHITPQSDDALPAVISHDTPHAEATAALLRDDDDNDRDMPSTDDATVLAYQQQTFLEARKHQEAHPEEQRPYYAACPYFDKIMSAFWGCSFMQASRRIMTRSCGNFSSIFSIKQPANPTGLWPVVLTDLRPDPPVEVPKALVAHERGTFYWLYRHVNNLYEYAYQEEGRGPTAPWPPVPPGWSEQRVHMVHETNVRLVFESFIDTPLAQTMMHKGRNTMLVVIRGTLSPQEWNFDYQYQFAEGQARQDFPGRVHQGVYGVYTLFADQVLAEVARLQPSHVFVTGHSLGGALSHLVAYTIANHHPEIRVDGVAFASIMMGDECLMTAIREKVNLRNVFYLGKGQDGHMYRVGDLIPQATWYVDGGSGLAFL